MDIVGKIKRIGNIEAKYENFCKRKLVLECKDKSSTYAQTIEFELKNGQVEAVDGFFEGDMIKVHFHIRGREITGRDGLPIVFNSLDVWRIEPVEDHTKSRRAKLSYAKGEKDSIELPF